MMRVLVLSNLFPNPGQPDRAPFNRQQLRALAGTGHEVRVIAPVAWTERLRAFDRREQDGMVVEHPRVWFVPKALRGWYGWCFRESVRRTFTRAVRQFRPQVVLGTWAYPDGWAAVSLAREAGLAAVVKVHGSDVLGLEAHPGRLRGTAAALAGADAVVAVSRDLAEKVERLVGRAEALPPLYVVRNGVDANVFHPGSRAAARRRLGLDDRPMVLFVGNLVAVKGLDVLLDACALLVRERVGFRCCLVGQGPLRERLQRRIEHEELAGHVELMGRRPLETLGDWYRAASVLALPSFSEGLPNVLLEAAACGTPIVASRVGGVPEIVSECGGVLVEPGDAAGLAAGIAGAVGQGGVDLQLPACSGRQADDLPAARGLSWEESARQLAGVLELAAPRPAVMDRRPGPSLRKVA